MADEEEKKDPRCTYSRYLAQYSGSDMAMKQQFVRMVHMMNKLNNVNRLRTEKISHQTINTLHLNQSSVQSPHCVEKSRLVASNVGVTPATISGSCCLLT